MSARRRPVTLRGETTVSRLLEAAAETFSSRGFHQASVAEICRLSRVANGTFYQYFTGKEEIFLAVVAEASERLTARLRRALSKARDPRKHILQAMNAYWSFIAENASLHQVLREAEFVRLEVLRRFYSQLADLYMSILREGQGQLQAFDPEATAYALLGIQEFLALRYLLWTQDFSHEIPRVVEGLLAYGLDGGTPRAPAEGQRETFEITEIDKVAEKSGGERTRARLLAAAEVEFGEHGFHKASVADIARRAGVAHGTVYLYFPGKEALFAELVREINRQLRAHIRRTTQGLHDRREVEVQGFEAFFEFIAKHPQAYRIVREAEFVGRGREKGQAGRWYYERLARGYIGGLREGMEAGQIRKLNPEVLAWALMGVGHFLGLRWIVWEGQLPPPRALQLLRHLLLHGLQ
jgi:AcrR family transcriptional regulator